MEISDFFKIFELVSFCLLPSSWDPSRHQIDIFGDFIDGINTPSDGELESEALSRNKNFQFLINVNSIDVLEATLTPFQKLPISYHQFQDIDLKREYFNIFHL